jgi:hypothetical protein
VPDTSGQAQAAGATIFGFFTRTVGEALVIPISGPDKWKETLRTLCGLPAANVILFDEGDWLIPKLKSKSIDELKKKYSLIMSTIKKQLVSQGVPADAVDGVIAKAEVIPNPISGLVVFVAVYSGLKARVKATGSDQRKAPAVGLLGRLKNKYKNLVALARRQRTGKANVAE